MLGRLFSTISCLKRKRSSAFLDGASDEDLAPVKRSRLEEPIGLRVALPFLDVLSLVAASRCNRALRSLLALHLPHALREVYPDMRQPTRAAGPSLAWLQPFYTGITLANMLGSDASVIEILGRLVIRHGRVAKAEQVMSLADGYPGDRCAVVVAALIALIRSGREAVCSVTCIALAIVLNGEEHGKALFCDFGGVPALASLIILENPKLRHTVIMVFFALTEFHDGREDGRERFALGMPVVSKMLEVLKKKVFRALLSSDLPANMASVLRQMSVDSAPCSDTQNMIELLVTILRRLFDIKLLLGMKDREALTILYDKAARALLDEGAETLLVSLIRQRINSDDEGLRDDANYILCVLLATLCTASEKCRDHVSSSHIYKGCRVYVRDSEDEPWLCGSVDDRKDKSWIVFCDNGPRRKTWQHMEAVEASGSLLRFMDSLHEARFIPWLVNAVCDGSITDRVVALKALDLFMEPVGSPMMRTSALEAGIIEKVLFTETLGSSSIDVISKLCAHSTAACKKVFELAGISHVLQRLHNVRVILENFEALEAQGKAGIVELPKNGLSCLMETIDCLSGLLYTIFEGERQAKGAAMDAGIVEELCVLVRLCCAKDFDWVALGLARTLLSAIFGETWVRDAPTIPEESADAAQTIVDSGTLERLSSLMSKASEDDWFKSHLERCIEAFKRRHIEAT